MPVYLCWYIGSAPAFARHVGVYSLSRLNGHASQFPFAQRAAPRSGNTKTLLGAMIRATLPVPRACSGIGRKPDLQRAARRSPRLAGMIPHSFRWLNDGGTSLLITSLVECDTQQGAHEVLVRSQRKLKVIYQRVPVNCVAAATVA
jgi:hypothetical protein